MPRDFLAQTFLVAAFILMAAAPGAQAQEGHEESRRRPQLPSGPPAIVLYSDTGLRGTSVELTADAPVRLWGQSWHPNQQWRLIR